MTPRQRSALHGIKSQLFDAECHLRRLNGKLDELTKLFDEEADAGAEDFTPAEVDDLIRLNQRLSELEHYLRAFGDQESAKLEARIADPNDPLQDYEIEAEIAYVLREDDPAFDEDDENYLTTRKYISLKRSDRKQERLADGQNHREIRASFPERINALSQCWLFHDLYDHGYGLESPELSLWDCLRVGSLWVDISVRSDTTGDRFRYLGG